MYTPKKRQCTSSKPNVFDSSKTKIFRFQRSRNSQNNKNIKHKQVHGYDDISIRMIKICDKSLLKPLILLFKNLSQQLVTQTFGKDLILFRRTKKVKNN